jgi:sugar lactone lactonase YvrE
VIAAQAAAGQAFLRPNDLIVDRRGGIYVTDPGPIGHKGKAFVYYVRPDGHVLLVSDDIRFPNGLTLTRDDTYLGTIRVPRQPTNLAFSGPDKRTLYITAREGLYRMIMLSQGPDRPGK